MNITGRASLSHQPGNISTIKRFFSEPVDTPTPQREQSGHLQLKVEWLLGPECEIDNTKAN